MPWVIKAKHVEIVHHITPICEDLMAIIKIKNLRLRTIIGIEEAERQSPQDIIINAEIEVDATLAARSDDIGQTYDYKTITKSIIHAVEVSQFFLLEKLTDHILELIMEDARVLLATVEIDKPQALRFADSVSLTHSAHREKPA